MTQSLAFAKLATGIVVGGSASKVISTVIRNNTNPETTQEIVQVYVGSVVLGSMVGDAASNYVVAKVAAMSASFREMKTELKEAKKTSK